MGEETYSSLSMKEEPQEPQIPITGKLQTDEGSREKMEIPHGNPRLEEGETRSLLSTNDSQETKILHEERPFRTKSTCCGVRLMMILWTCLGLAVALSHHLVCRHLNGRSVEERLPFGNKFFTYQQIINAAGNVMALVVNTSFQAAIGLLFVQQFWFQIRRRSFSVNEINAIITIQNNPLSPSAFKIFRSATLLLTVALFTFSLSIISVVAPGSLVVAQSNFTQQNRCEVPQIQLQFPDVLSNYIFNPTSNLVNSSLPAIRDLAGVALLLKTYLPPTTPCGQCKYSITIDAPAIKCQNISSSPGIGPMTVEHPQPIASLLPPINARQIVAPLHLRDLSISPNDGYGSYTLPTLTDNFVWNATYSLNETGLVLLAVWRSGDFKNDTYGQIRATACVAYNATYYANVVHGISASTMDVTSVDFHNNLTMPDSSQNDAIFNETVSMFAMVDALAYQIQGVLSFDINGNPASQTSMASYTLGTINDGYWDWATDPQIAIPVMMQNFTLSMLARNLGSDPTQSTVGNVSQECWLSPLAFQYDELRLTGIYAYGALVTVLCVLAGFWLIKQNAIDESFDLSRWMDGLVHRDMLDKVQSGELTPDTPLQLRKHDGRLDMREIPHQHIQGSP